MVWTYTFEYFSIRVEYKVRVNRRLANHRNYLIYCFTMVAITSLVLLSVYLQNYVHATSSTCILEGLHDINWLNKYYLNTTINDTYRGELAVIPTKNIQRVKVKGNKYFNVTWENQTLRLATGDNFDRYELESEYTDQPTISLSLYFDCTEDDTKHLTIVQKINDTNNHAPRLNQESFEYTFGMTLPKDYVLTNVLPIYAVDEDVSNGEVYFSIPTNDYFKIDNKGYSGAYGLKQFSTKLVALQPVSAPFSQDFELTVTDGGKPPQQTVSTISINVLTPEDFVAPSSVHPPVFAKHFYFAYYTHNSFEMEEAITLKSGALNTTILKQTGYETYFNASIENSTVVIHSLKALPSEILALDFIVLEIEAVNEELPDLPGRTALLIEFTDNENITCKLDIFGYSMGYPMILLASAILSIVLINICVIVIFLRKQKKYLKSG